jgi:phenylacetate-CoA ligase
MPPTPAAPTGPTYAGQLGPEPRDPDQPFWDPAVQTMAPEQLRDLQADRLRTMVGRLLAGAAPHFAGKVADAGITDPGDIASIADINRIPTTVKDELRASEAAHPPFGDYRFTTDGIVRIGTSTGTTGTPTIATFTRHDIWLEYESAARNFWRNGWRPGMRITHAHPAYLYGGGMMLSGSLEYFGMLNLWVAPPDDDELARKGIEMWLRVNPDVNFVAFAFNRFQEVAAEMGIDLHEDCGFPQFEFKGASELGLPFMTAGLECYAYAGGPCGVEPGGHLHEDWAVIQAIDPRTGEDVADGEWGNLVVTTLDRDNGLLRYDLEEAVLIQRAPCPCGETTAKAFWGGRFKDFLDVQGKYFQISAVEQALLTVGAVAEPSLEYVVVRPTDSTAPLRIRVELADGDEALVAGQCAAAIASAVGVEADVEVLARQSLERSGYKQTRLVDG